MISQWFPRSIAVHHLALRLRNLLSLMRTFAEDGTIQWDKSLFVAFELKHWFIQQLLNFGSNILFELESKTHIYPTVLAVRAGKVFSHSGGHSRAFLEKELQIRRIETKACDC